MVRSFLLVALLAASAPALAQEGEDTASATPPDRIRNVQLVGDQKCPEAAEGEVVVCGRIDEDEMFRIPKELRRGKPTPASTAWAKRAETVTDVNRIGMPGSCSPVGAGGQTGCTMMMLQNWAAEKVESRRQAP